MNASPVPAIRPFAEWTIGYVRKMVRAGVLTAEDAARFVDAFGDGLTLAELLPVAKEVRQ